MFVQFMRFWICETGEQLLENTAKLSHKSRTKVIMIDPENQREVWI